MVAVRDRLAEFTDTDGSSAVIALVTFSDPTFIDGYGDEHGLSFPVLIDQERTTYRRYGLGRGTVARVWGWRAAKRYVELIRRDGLRALRRPTEDTLQLGGDFVIGVDGSLVYGFWGEGPDDRPEVGDLVDAVGRAWHAGPDDS